MVPGIKDKGNEVRLRMLNLFKLSKRRLRGDLIEAFKFIKGINKVNVQFFRTIALPLSQELPAPTPVTHLKEPAYSVGQSAVDEAGRWRGLGGRMEA